MLDKSVSYQHIIMKLDNEKNHFGDNIELPDGFSFSFYREGYERYWARTEHLVLEFDTELLAYEYFAKNMLPYKDDLKRRMVFILNENKEPIANACAWYIDYKGADLQQSIGFYKSTGLKNTTHQAQVHYVAVQPKYQGMGLGKAIFKKILYLFNQYEPSQDIFLHTQTWSHRAVKMYLKMGFILIKDDTIGYGSNQYNEAVRILEEVYKRDYNERIK